MLTDSFLVGHSITHSKNYIKKYNPFILTMLQQNNQKCRLHNTCENLKTVKNPDTIIRTETGARASLVMYLIGSQLIMNLINHN